MSGTIWYAARAGGVIAYLLLSAGAVLGLTLSRRRPLPWPKFAVEEVHRFVTVLTGFFLALHVGAILVDSYLPFSVGQVLVPFSAPYRPLATGLGTVALELLVAVALTNAFRRDIPHRLWRTAHYATFPVWVAATLHGLLAGSDRHTLWFLLVMMAGVASVAAAASARFSPAAPQRAIAWAAAATLAAGALTLVPQHSTSRSASAGNASGSQPGATTRA
jgi:predicted ferric reductase